MYVYTFLTDGSFVNNRKEQKKNEINREVIFIGWRRKGKKNIYKRRLLNIFLCTFFAKWMSLSTS